MFYRPDKHQRVGEIIRQYSANPEDIREVILSKIDSARIGSILDLGCGYGLFLETLIASNQKVLRLAGIDSNPDNREHFLKRASKCCENAIFIRQDLPKPIDFSANSFDLIVALYSLYFFIDILPEVRRLITLDGFFVAATHCADSFQELNIFLHDVRLFSVLKNFHDKNGADLLKKYFRSVFEIPYPNTLFFTKEGKADLFFYLRFKRPFWLNEEQSIIIERAIDEQMDKTGAFQLTKNDVFYICQP